MEKTQSISIIDNFASVDDPRMERAGKRKLGGGVSGIPSNDAFGRVFSLIDERRFQDIFIEWTKRVGKPPKGRSRRIGRERAGIWSACERYSDSLNKDAIALGWDATNVLFLRTVML